MVKETAPIDAIKDGTPGEKKFYLRTALWSDKGWAFAKKEVRDNDLIFWMGGTMPHVSRVKCDTQEEAVKVVEKFKDGFLPEEGWQISGLILNGLKLRVTDKELNILADITISEEEIAQGRTKDGIQLVCEEDSHEQEPLEREQVEVVLEGLGENATQSWTVHASAGLDLSAAQLVYKKIRNQTGHQYLVDYCYYDKLDREDVEFHQWRRVHSSRYGIGLHPDVRPIEALIPKTETELRIAIAPSSVCITLRAWLGAESIPVGEIAKNPKKYERQFDKLSRAIDAWHGQIEEFMDKWSVNLGIYSAWGLIAFQEELKKYEINDYRSGEVQSREAEFRKLYICDTEETLGGADWKECDGEDAAIKIMAQQCGVTEEIARAGLDEGVWDVPRW